MVRTRMDYPKAQRQVGANCITATIIDAAHLMVQSHLDPAQRGTSCFVLNGKSYPLCLHYCLDTTGHWVTTHIDILSASGERPVPRATYPKILMTINEAVVAIMEGSSGEALRLAAHKVDLNNEGVRLEDKVDELRTELREATARLNAVNAAESLAYEGKIITVDEVLA